MLSHHAFDSISASEDSCLRDLAVSETEYDVIWVLFDICQAFVESHALCRYETGHDVEQLLPVSLAELVNVTAFMKTRWRARTDLRLKLGWPQDELPYQG